MITPLLAVLALYLVQVLIPSTLRGLVAPGTSYEKLMWSLSPRDAAVGAGLRGLRAERALANMKESLPIFIALALSHVALQTESVGAEHAAWVFFGARCAYVPAYIFDPVLGLRSTLWAIALGALGVMAVALAG